MLALDGDAVVNNLRVRIEDVVAEHMPDHIDLLFTCQKTPATLTVALALTLTLTQAEGPHTVLASSMGGSGRPSTMAANSFAMATSCGLSQRMFLRGARPGQGQA